MTFGEKIKDARKHKKLTQKQLADSIGAAHNSVSDWENDKNRPDPDTIELICGILDITPNYLLGKNEDVISPFDKELISSFHNQLDDTGRDNVLYIMNSEIKRVQTINELKMKVDILEAELSDEFTNIEDAKKYLYAQPLLAGLDSNSTTESDLIKIANKIYANNNRGQTNGNTI